MASSASTAGRRGTKAPTGLVEAANVAAARSWVSDRARVEAQAESAGRWLRWLRWALVGLGSGLMLLVPPLDRFAAVALLGGFAASNLALDHAQARSTLLEPRVRSLAELSVCAVYLVGLSLLYAQGNPLLPVLLLAALPAAAVLPFGLRGALAGAAVAGLTHMAVLAHRLPPLNSVEALWPSAAASGALLGEGLLLGLWREWIARRRQEMADLVADRDRVLALARARWEQLEARTAALEEATRLRSQFVAAITHELRTPLHSIIGYTQVLLDGLSGDLNAEQRADLGRVHESSEVLLHLINNVLDLAKIEAGRLEATPQVVDVREATQRVLDQQRPAAEAQHVRLRNDVGEGLYVWADGLRVQQVLTNLVANAIKFGGRADVLVRAQREGQQVRTTVVDNGIGIPDDSQELIFEAFRQADQTTTRRYRGTGLGLTICRQLVQLMGGEIGVRSAVGLGSEFWFTLPSSEPEQRAAGRPQALPRPALVDLESRDGTSRSPARTWNPAGSASVSATLAACPPASEPWGAPELQGRRPEQARGTVVAAVDHDPFARELLARLLGDEGRPVVSVPLACDLPQHLVELAAEAVVLHPGARQLWETIERLQFDERTRFLPLLLAVRPRSEQVALALAAAACLVDPRASMRQTRAAQADLGLVLLPARALEGSSRQALRSAGLNWSLVDSAEAALTAVRVAGPSVLAADISLGALALLPLFDALVSDPALERLTLLLYATSDGGSRRSSLELEDWGLEGRSLRPSPARLGAAIAFQAEGGSVR